MPVRDEGGACFKKWSTLIKADKISEVLAEAAEINIAGEKALECLVHISQLAYKDAQNGIPFSSPPDDIVQLTEVLSSLVISRPSLCNLRFISSLYHVAFFFFKKNRLVCLKQIYKIIIETKRTNISTFQGDGSKVYDNFILLLQKVIPKLSLNEDSQFDHHSREKEFFSLLLDLLVVEDEVENGSKFLETVLYASQTVAKQNKKSAVILISKGLQLFFEVKKIKDVDSSLAFIFKLFSSHFHYQLDLYGYASALGLVLSHTDTYKWKFGEENILHGECFYLVCQTKMFMSSQSEIAVRKMIENANTILGKFKHMREKKDFVKEACLLIIYLVSNLKESKTISSSVLLGPCLEPFLEMMHNLYNSLIYFNVDKYYYIHFLSQCFLLISEGGLTKKDLLTKCLKIILKTEALILETNQMLRSENHAKADCYTKLVLARCANLIRSYHLASLQEEVIAVSKPFCKFMCTLPANTFDDASNKSWMELSFTCLIQALGPKQLYEVLQVAVAWLIVCPQSSDKVFRLWGDVKHNATCAGGNEFLGTTVFTIVTEGKSSLEDKWLPCNLTSAQLGHLLVKELNTYFINSSLRGSPVLEAAKALESVATDVLTQARGVVVALDVASARSEFAEHCDHYESRSRQLIATLRKQKKEINPVDFNCCMGELLYAQFRLKLKSFRSHCEGEVLRLSALHESAGPLIPELPEERADPDDTCDVTTRYTNLTLVKQQEVLADLEAAVTHWRVACTRLTEKEGVNITKYDLRVILKYLQEAAFIMKLYCDEVKEGELWRLLYNLALLADDGDKIVIAVGEMLKTKYIDRAAVDEAEDVLDRYELLQKTKHAFLLNKALFHLGKNEIAEGVKLLKVEIEARKSLTSMQYIYCHIILGLYQKLSAWETVGEQFLLSSSCHLSFHKALSHLLYLSQQEKWNCLMEASYIQLNLLEMSYQLGEINWSLEQPREARCYLKSQLSLAQKLGLPLRTAQLLLVLAWVDLYTGTMADCAVKLEGLEALLNLQGAPASYVAGLDSPNKLSKEEVWSPEFLGHRAGCDCFVCRCIEYQRLVLETLTLRATFCANHNQVPLALQSFKVAFQVQDYLSSSDDNKVQTSSCWMLKHYADTLALCNKPQDGLNMTNKAIDTLPSIQNPPILLQHILHQKSGLQSMTTCHLKPVRHRIVIETEDTLTTANTPMKKLREISSVPAKTPLSVVTGNITPQFVRPVRKFTLPSSGEENTPPPPKSSPKSKRRIKTPLKFRLETPQTSNQLPKTIKTPFTIVDDDGNAVGVVSSKVSSRKIKKIDIKTNSFVDPIHKKLFSSVDKKSNVPVIFKSPERKSSRKPKARTTEMSKPVKSDSRFKKPESSCTNQSTSKEELKTELFSFDELNQEVNKIKCSIPKSTYAKRSSKLSSNNANGTRSHPAPVPGDIDSDCSMVEATPTPPGTRKPRRATRSNKT